MSTDQAGLDYLRRMPFTCAVAMLVSLFISCEKVQQQSAQGTQPGKKTIFDAIRKGNTEELALMVSKGVDLNQTSQGPEGGWTPIMEAARTGNSQIFTMLLKAGADPAIVSATGKTALHAAVNGCNISIVDTLIDRGMDINAIAINGESPIFDGLRCGWPMVAHLIERGADVKIAGSRGVTLLMKACSEHRSEIVQQLLSLESDVNRQATDGTTALHVAALEADSEIVATLLRAGAIADAADSLGNTPLIIAAFNGDSRTVKLLIDAGADVNHRSSNGETAIFNASSNQNAECAKLLLQAGAATNVPTKSHGLTPLLNAVQNGTPETITALVDAGADLRTKNQDGQGILEIAMARYAGADTADGRNGLRVRQLVQDLLSRGH